MPTKNKFEALTPLVDVESGSGHKLRPIPGAPAYSGGSGMVSYTLDDVSLINEHYFVKLRKAMQDIISKVSGLVPTIELDDVINARGEVVTMVIVQFKCTLPSPEGMHAIACEAQLYCGDKFSHGEVDDEDKKFHWDTATYKTKGNGTNGKRKGVWLSGSVYRSTAKGIFIGRDYTKASVGSVLIDMEPEDFWLRDYQEEPSEHIGLVEMRYSGSGHITFMRTVIQLSHILTHGTVLESRLLMALIYRELGRIGTEALAGDKLYGLQAAKDQVHKHLLLPLEQPEDVAQFGNLEPRSILMVGVTGVGKTYLKRHLLWSEHPVVPISVPLEKLREGLKGGYKDLLRQIDEIIELTGLPVLLLVDDIDALSEYSEMLMNLLDGIGNRSLYMLASTNHPERLDPRLLEPTRLGKLVHLGLPEEDDRTGILATHMASHPFTEAAERQAVARLVAQATEGYSSRALFDITTAGARNCIMRCNGKGPNPTAEDYKSAVTEDKPWRVARLKAWDEGLVKFVNGDAISAEELTKLAAGQE